MNDRESIETAFQRVRSGELSPAEATRLLLASEHSADESLSSLIGRLGRPPSDVMETWCHQASAIANLHEQRTGEGLPALNLSDWSLTSQGQLRWRGLSCEVDEAGVPEWRQSREHLDQFRQQLQAVEIATASPTAPSSIITPPETLAASAAGSHERESTVSRGKGKHRQIVMVAVGLLACIAGGGYLLHQASTFDQANVAQSDASRHAPEAADVPFGLGGDDRVREGGAVVALPNSDLTVDDLETLETLESMTAWETTPLESEADLTPAFSLEDLIPATAGLVSAHDTFDLADEAAPSPLESEGGPSLGASPLNHSEPPMANATMGDLNHETQEPDESPQQTRTSQVMAVELPRLDDGHPVTLAAGMRSDLRLEFPLEVPLRLEGQSPWEIWDTRQEVVVATIESEAGGTQLRWKEEAAKSPGAISLGHGRIQVAMGETIFLRPSIEADPWPIRLDQSDVMPTWNLRHPIPPRVTRLALEFKLPEEIELGWIEPIDPAALRRTRGLAVLTPKDTETVSLGVRFDVRCSRKLSVRVRYAARLAPAMPWQVVSNAKLGQWANQLTEQARLVRQEAARLERVHRMVDSSGRRIIRIKQERNDERGETIQIASQRVTQLQTMVARLETAGSLQVRVWVQWLESQQVLLSTSNDIGGQ